MYGMNVSAGVRVVFYSCRCQDLRLAQNLLARSQKPLGYVIIDKTCSNISEEGVSRRFEFQNFLLKKKIFY